MKAPDFPQAFVKERFYESNGNCRSSLKTIRMRSTPSAASTLFAFNRDSESPFKSSVISANILSELDCCITRNFKEYAKATTLPRRKLGEMGFGIV